MSGCNANESVEDTSVRDRFAGKNQQAISAISASLNLTYETDAVANRKIC
jgi:hypothetical protein